MTLITASRSTLEIPADGLSTITRPVRSLERKLVGAAAAYSRYPLTARAP